MQGHAIASIEHAPFLSTARAGPSARAIATAAATVPDAYLLHRLQLFLGCANLSTRRTSFSVHVQNAIP